VAPAPTHDKPPSPKRAAARKPAARTRPAPQDGPTLLIRASREVSGIWRVEAVDHDTGAVAARPTVPPNSRIGRALEALAAELASRPPPRR
jgi:hypothetical protein